MEVFIYVACFLLIIGVTVWFGRTSLRAIFGIRAGWAGNRGPDGKPTLIPARDLVSVAWRIIGGLTSGAAAGAMTLWAVAFLFTFGSLCLNAGEVFKHGEYALGYVLFAFVFLGIFLGSLFGGVSGALGGIVAGWSCGLSRVDRSGRAAWLAGSFWVACVLLFYLKVTVRRAAERGKIGDLVMELLGLLITAGLMGLAGAVLGVIGHAAARKHLERVGNESQAKKNFDARLWGE